MRKDWQDAVDAGDAPAVRALIDGGADIDALDRYGQSGLMRAANRGRLEVVKLLLERGAEQDRTAKYGLTALMLAIVNMHAEVGVALVEAGARLDLTGSGAPGFAGLTARDLAQARGLESVVAAIKARG